jgi:IS30 family transposase
VERFPFRIHTVRTDNGHEFQAKFHWHVEDQGMSHIYIKPRSPNLSGKEEDHNVHRPHAGLKGLIAYEALREKLVS